MNNYDSYINKDDITSLSWPDPVCAMGDYPYRPCLSVPRSTHLDLLSALGDPSTAGTHAPDFNAVDDAEFSLAPELRAFADLIAQIDRINQVSNQFIGSSTLTYLAMSQNGLGPWLMPGPCMFLSRICYDPSYLLMRT